MGKVLSIALGVAIAVTTAGVAQAQSSPVEKIIAQEDAKARPDDRPGPYGLGAVATTVLRPDDRPGLRGVGGQTVEAGAQAEPSPVDLIIAQERGRHGDGRVFGPSGLAPIQVVAPAGGFDWGDAGIGSAATLAFALLAAAGMALRTNGRAQRAHE